MFPTKEIPKPLFLQKLFWINGTHLWKVNTDSNDISNRILKPFDYPLFICGETYSLRIDVKGSPALRFLDHNAYLTVSAYTGCCAEGSIAPTPVDPLGDAYTTLADCVPDIPADFPVVLALLSGISPD